MSARNRSEILVIAKTPPLHDRNSADHRLFQILRLLAREHSVDFLSTWHAVLHRFKEKPVSYVVRDGTFSHENLEFLDHEYLEDLRSVGVNTLNQAEPVPFTVRPTNDYDIRPFLTGKRYDVIWLEYFYQADQYLDEIRQLQPWAEVVVDSVDLHFLRQERQVRYLESQVKYSVSAEQEKRPLGENFAKDLQDHRNYAAHVKEHELRSYARCDRVVVTSDDDARELRNNLPYSDIGVITNVHEPRTTPVPGPQGREGVVFTANFDHGPNSSSAIFLKHEIAPLVREKIGPVPFILLGNNPPYLIRNMETMGPCADQFRIVGHVPDTTPHLDRARVSVAPLFFGSGMSGKIGEALAAGVPVVTTALGALGLGLTHEENCLIAETPEEFAVAIERLHRDDALWERLSQAGSDFVEEHFGPSAVATRLRQAFPPAAGSRDTISPEKHESASAPNSDLPPASFPEAADPEISVIVLCHNQWRYTELCLRSLAHAQALSPKLQVEYILVDNASADATVEEAQKIPGLHVIANPENVGFAAGNNVGIRAARGRNIVLLNNDTVVPPFWLQRLHDHAQRVKRVGIIGPSTNTEPGQALFGARYNGIDELFAYNREIGRGKRGQWELCEKISGLCMYVPRAVIEEVGLLSEDYGMGYFEDDDYCFRVRDAGYRTLWAKDTYVHHFGSVSFEHSSVSREKHLNFGMSQFIFKWGKRALKHIAKSHRQTLIKPAELHS